MTAGNSTDSLPLFHLLERIAPSVPALERLEDEIASALSALHLPAEKLRGRSIAVTAGSRGIASLKEIVRAACGWLKAHGAHPFVFPAMGSHGGATAEGQRRILEDYGVTEEFVGAPIRSLMETVRVGATSEGLPVFMDRLAWEADGVLVMNRVKPHTTFSGRVESGLLKMMAVGMGKAEGAREFHRAAQAHGYERAVRDNSTVVLGSGKILAGLAVIENEMHQICGVRAAAPVGVVALDESCLANARRLVPRLPFSKLDLLVVDEIGKNVSGTGMDAKAIGRSVISTAGEAPDIRLIYARDLTAESNGNALGVGLADLVHERLRAKIDFEKMYVNARTSLSHHLVRLPMVMRTDREALSFALEALGRPAVSDLRMVWVRNTQNLGRLAISEHLAQETSALAGWRLSPEAPRLEFSSEGNLESIL